MFEKHKPASGEWKFSATGAKHDAVLEYDEQIIPDLKHKRRLAIRFAVKLTPTGPVAAVEIRAKSPLNSFSCNRLAKAVVAELKEELREVAA